VKKSEGILNPRGGEDLSIRASETVDVMAKSIFNGWGSDLGGGNDSQCRGQTTKSLIVDLRPGGDENQNREMKLHKRGRKIGAFLEGAWLNGI